MLKNRQTRKKPAIVLVPLCLLFISLPFAVKLSIQAGLIISIAVCITGIIFAGYECCIAALLFLSLVTVRHSNPYDYADSIQKFLTPVQPLAYNNILSHDPQAVFTLRDPRARYDLTGTHSEQQRYYKAFPVVPQDWTKSDPILLWGVCAGYNKNDNRCLETWSHPEGKKLKINRVYNDMYKKARLKSIEQHSLRNHPQARFITLHKDKTGTLHLVYIISHYLVFILGTAFVRRKVCHE